MNFKTFFTDLIHPNLIVAFVIIIILALLFTMFFSSRVTVFKVKYLGKFYPYIIILLLTSALITFLGSSEVFNSKLFDIYIFYQITIFIIGIIHCYLYYKYFDQFEADKEKKIDINEFIFAILNAFYMLIPFLIIFTIIKGNNYVFDMMLSVITFIIPTFIYSTFKASINIPEPLTESWQFPEKNAFSHPNQYDQRDLLVITFLFYKNENSKVRTEFRAKAPFRMDFGRLFYHFINDYNLRNPDEPIKIEDEAGNRQHWVFRLKTNFFGLTTHINPNKPCYINNIKENSVIICTRIQPENNTYEEQIKIENNKSEQETNQDN